MRRCASGQLCFCLRRRIRGFRKASMEVELDKCPPWNKNGSRQPPVCGGKYVCCREDASYCDLGQVITMFGSGQVAGGPARQANRLHVVMSCFTPVQPVPHAVYFPQEVTSIAQVIGSSNSQLAAPELKKQLNRFTARKKLCLQIMCPPKLYNINSLYKRDWTIQADSRKADAQYQSQSRIS